jgi:hypothetical protein
MTNNGMLRMADVCPIHCYIHSRGIFYGKMNMDEKSIKKTIFFLTLFCEVQLAANQI